MQFTWPRRTDIPHLPPMPSVAHRQDLTAGADIPRHRHDAPYAAVVLAGGYEEAGDSGRLWVEAGMVVVHDAYHAHLNRSVTRRAQVLNLTMPIDTAAAVGRLADADAVARVAERDVEAAAALILRSLAPERRVSVGWPDDLAAALEADDEVCLGAWAGTRGLAAETLSRGFGQAFGVTPSRFRLEARARRAWRALTSGGAPLASLAAEMGFADQAHMSRAVKALTGAPPGAWRASNRFKTGG
jgi:AraC-like DNA-binding protein